LKTYLAFLSLILFFSVSCNRENTAVKSKNNIDLLLEKTGSPDYSNAQKESFTDSVMTQLSGYKNDSVTRNYYFKATASYYNLDLYRKLFKSAKKSYQLSIEDNDSIRAGKGLYLMGLSFYESEKNDSAFYYYTQAEKIFKPLKSREDLAQIALYKAYTYSNIGEHALAETEAIKALTLFEQKDAYLLFSCYTLLAASLEELKNYTEALKYYGLALAEIENLKKEGYPPEAIDFHTASCYNNTGRIYAEMGDYNKAISLYNEAIATEGIKEQPSLYAKLLNNLGASSFKKGDEKTAFSLYSKSLKIRDSINYVPGIITSHIKLGEYYIAKHDTVQAINHLELAYAKAKTMQSHSDILRSLKLLSEIDRDKSAFYSGRYVKVTDSLQDIARNNRNKFARIEYETEKLETEKTKLTKRNTVITAIFIIAILLVLAIFAIHYLRAKNKRLLMEQEQQKANEEIYQLMLEQQEKIDSARAEEKNRIAMELHDGILNNIYAARLKLYSFDKKPDDSSEFIDKAYDKELHDLALEIRSVSHELSQNAVINTEKSFEGLLSFMIDTQKNSFNTQFDAIINPEIDWENMSNVRKVNIYRIIQEALQNINKYSKAKSAAVNISADNNNIYIEIKDNGIGFDTSKITSGIGIKNLKKRTETLKGSFTIESQPGKGAVINVTFPA
jgi:signal transduction histidine kinase